MVDLPSPHPNYRKLQAELNREIFLCFNPASQRKFICGLGWGFYAMFRQKLLSKTKRLCNPAGNVWNIRNSTIFLNGFVLESQMAGFQNIYAEKAFTISGEHFREDNFPGTIIYYYEVKELSSDCAVGLSDGAIPGNFLVGQCSNSYAIGTDYNCMCLAGEHHRSQLSRGAVRPEREPNGKVYGCGLLMDANDKLSIFFTSNGILIGRQIPINPSIDHLFPTVGFGSMGMSLEANFGDNPAKPFEYDIKNCPGMELEWI